MTARQAVRTYILDDRFWPALRAARVESPRRLRYNGDDRLCFKGGMVSGPTFTKRVISRVYGKIGGDKLAWFAPGDDATDMWQKHVLEDVTLCEELAGYKAYT